jgi:hypothetical protein
MRYVKLILTREPGHTFPLVDFLDVFDQDGAMNITAELGRCRVTRTRGLDVCIWLRGGKPVTAVELPEGHLATAEARATADAETAETSSPVVPEVDAELMKIRGLAEVLAMTDGLRLHVHVAERHIDACRAGLARLIREGRVEIHQSAEADAIEADGDSATSSTKKAKAKSNKAAPPA